MTQRNLVAVITALLIFMLQIQLSAQFIDANPCGGVASNGDESYSITIPNGNINQSSTIGGGFAQKAVDGDFSDESTARSEEEQNAWIELDLGEVHNLNNLQIYYPDGEGMQKYYILLSETPFGSVNLGVEMANQSTGHIFVSSLPSGAEIPMDNQSVRYIRIQLADKGRIVVTEVLFFAGPNDDETENCTNGADDDCDGLIDCEDPDCSGWINESASVTINPTCPICADGEIHIYGQSSDNVTKYSIDNGQTWQDSRFFYNLDEGDYYAWIKNPFSGCLREFEGNPIELRSPPGDPNGHCPNGDFEDGDFTGWTGGLGTYEGEDGVFTDPVLTINNDDFDDATMMTSRHRIMQSSGNSDPNVPNIILTPPGGGTFFARLGNETKGGKATRLTYCFTVDDDNKDFFFNFAIVIEDPDDHSGLEKPFFEYKMFTPGNSTNEFAKEKFNSSDDGFFNEFNDILYRNWTCRRIDLSNRIGQEVCIRFVVADCSKGNHYGYAYIDGLCSSSDAQIPINNFDINPTICLESDNFLVDASSVNVNKYTWEVCQINTANGFEFACESKEFEGDVLPFDIKEFYENEHGSFTCDRRYRVRLTASNECFDGDTVEKTVFVTCPKEIDYEDVTYCTNGGGPTPVIGTNNCTNCTYEWIATDNNDPIAFDNPNVAFPNIINFPAGAGGTRTVAVTVTDNDTGCVYSDEVSVRRYNSQPLISISNDDTYLCPEPGQTDCELIFFVEIRTALSFGELKIQLQNVDNGVIFNDYELTSTITQNFPTLIYTYKIRYILDGLSDGVEDESTYKFTVELNEFEGVNHVGCSAEAEIIVPDLPFWGDIPDMFFPNAFSPNNDGVNDLFMPFPATPNEYNVSWYKFQIFGQNGGLFHESEGCAPPGGFNLGDISWDGKNDDGQNLNPGVFVYLLRLDNCNNERPDMPGFPFINGDCNNPTCWYGDVTLLQ